MQSHQRPTDITTSPPGDVVAFVVRQCCVLKNWKVSTLADFATVEVSTVERVERGEKVGEEALDLAEGEGRRCNIRPPVSPCLGAFGDYCFKRFELCPKLPAETSTSFESTYQLTWRLSLRKA